MPWFSFKEVSARFDDVHLVDTPILDRVIERTAALQRYGLSVRQHRLVSLLYAKAINRRLDAIAPDVVLSIGASHKLVQIDPKWKIIHVSDALFTTMVNYYEKFGRFRQGVLRSGHADMQTFLNRVEKVLFASEWARASAVELYDCDEARLSVVPFGANLEKDPGLRLRRPDGPLVLLFVGYDWKRKGGPTLLEAWEQIHRRRPDSQLHIVGCRPDSARGLPGVTVHGRLNKADPRDYAKLIHLYDHASMFFMPSRQEAFGMVFCEAAAYGLPVVATDTGGVPTVVDDGRTGILLPPDSPPSAYVEKILDLWAEKPRFNAYSLAARRRYETFLNWSAWTSGLEAAIDDVVPSSRPVRLAAPAPLAAAARSVAAVPIR